jgi:predicted dehydrogenase
MPLNLVSIGIVGCGRVADHYFKIFDSGVVKNFKIVGAADLVIEKTEIFRKRFSCLTFTSIEEMFQKVKPDLVLVLTPSSLHFSHSKIALENGCNVLVEKPISMTPVEAESLSIFSKENGLLYGVAFQNRLNPAVQALRQAVDGGRFGKIVSATVRLRWCRFQNYYEDGWHGTWEHDGGVINQQAIHHLDALNWLFPIDSVNAIATNRLNNLEAEDTLVALVKFKDGAVGTIEATTAARPKDYEASLSVVGEKGMALIGGIALNEVQTWDFIDVEEGDKEVFRTHSQAVPTGYGLSHGPLLNEVISAINGQHQVMPVTAEDAIATTKLVHALYKSDEQKNWVALSDNLLSARLGVKS